MKRIEVAIHTDESGLFRAADQGSGKPAWSGEPFLLAGIVTRAGGFTPEEAQSLWDSLGLGPASRFHASECRADARKILDVAAQRAIDALRRTPGARLEAVVHRYAPRVGLPREDVYLDLVTHLVLGAVRSVVRAEVARTDWEGLVPLKVEINLARREGLNLRPLEKALERAIARDLRLSGLAKQPGRKKRGAYLKRGVFEGAVHVHCSVIPVAQSAHLTLSDLLCNALYRWLSQRRGDAQEMVRQISTQELLLFDEAEWAAVMADDPVGPGRLSTEPVNEDLLTDRLAELIARTAPTTVGGLRGGGLWPQAESAQDREGAIRWLLEESEAACEQRKDLEGSQSRASLAAAMLADREWCKGLEPTALERLRVACDSVRLGVVNHRGQPLPSWLDEDQVKARSARLVADAANHDAIALLHNRLAVNALNRFDFEAAAADAGALVDVLRRERGGFGALFGATPAPSWQYGALLGTTGQALALRGYVTGDRALVERAIDCFLEAGQQFDAPADKLRQCSYLAHAHLDLVRMSSDEELRDEWFEMLDLMGDELDADVAGFCADPANPEAWRQAFAVHVRLKQAWLLGDVPAWAAAVVEPFALAVGEGVLSHPRQQVAGMLALILDLPVTHPLVGALQRTGVGDTLVHVIARLYALDVATPEPPRAERVRGFAESLPGWLVPGWEREGMTDALRVAVQEGRPCVDVLPFYYF